MARLSRRSTISSPCTSSTNRVGVDTSSSTDWPAGMTTVSPSTGGSWYFHVDSDDHLSRYDQCTTPPSYSASPLPPESPLDISMMPSAMMEVRGDVTHVTEVPVAAVMVHGMPFSMTEPSPGVAGRFTPVSVTIVPPSAVPLEGEMEVMTGVAEVE